MYNKKEGNIMYNFINNISDEDSNNGYQPGPAYGAALFDTTVEDLVDSMSSISTTVCKEYRISYYRFMVNWNLQTYKNRLTMSDVLLSCAKLKLAHLRPDVLKSFVFKNVIYNTNINRDYIFMVPKNLIKLNNPSNKVAVSQVIKNNTDQLDLSDLYKK